MNSPYALSVRVTLLNLKSRNHAYSISLLNVILFILSANKDVHFLYHTFETKNYHWFELIKFGNYNMFYTEIAQF